MHFVTSSWIKYHQDQYKCENIRGSFRFVETRRGQSVSSSWIRIAADLWHGPDCRRGVRPHPVRYREVQALKPDNWPRLWRKSSYAQWGELVYSCHLSPSTKSHPEEEHPLKVATDNNIQCFTWSTANFTMPIEPSSNCSNAIWSEKAYRRLPQWLLLEKNWFTTNYCCNAALFFFIGLPEKPL